MWKQDFKYYSPIEKLFIVICFGQILKGVGNLLDIEYPTVASFVPSVIWKRKSQPMFERVLFFDVSDKDIKSIKPNWKGLALLK